MLLDTLLQIARKSIESSFDESISLDKKQLQKEYKELNEDGATFVTLTKNGQLRGCIGSLIAYENLYDNVFENARKAAFSDPRFPSLTKEELSEVRVEVSLLSTPKKLEYKNIEDLKNKLIANEHGIILKHYNHQATFLPQVWEQLPNFEEFMLHLCHKAGLNISCLNEGAEISIYGVQKVKEKE